mmetsp:Transcript_34446/g.79643  ORF Transcript_34446/g.79643 Transcript_34446/m.79643 type:complete len:522 (-) Transcript_34446:241-1806(-)
MPTSLPHEITSISRQFTLKRDEIALPILQFVFRGDNKRHEYAKNGLAWPPLSIVTVCGMAGSGKTTLAATIAQSGKISQAFDTICFINLGDRLLSKGGVNNVHYSTYLECLRKICHQIGVSPNLFYDKNIFLPKDKSIKKAAKTIQAIEEAKFKMSKLMDGLKIFFVLDDVWCHEDVDLFNFGKDMRSSFCLFVTSRNLDESCSAQTLRVNIPLLSVEDSILFYIIESGLGSDKSLPTTENFDLASKIVQECGYLPLAIRIASRISRTRAYQKSSQSNFDLEHITKIIMNTGYQDHFSPPSSGNQTVMNILDRSFSVVTEADVSYAVKVCFGAMAAVFHRDGHIRPWIKRDVVEIFWTKMLDSFSNLKLFKPKLYQYRLGNTKDVMNILYTMGLINMRERKQRITARIETEVQIHHDLLWEYGKMVVIEFEKNRTDIHRNSMDARVSFSGGSCSNLENVSFQLHLLIIDCYQEKLDSITSIDDEDPYETCDTHVLLWLPHHLIQAKKVRGIFRFVVDENLP